MADKIWIKVTYAAIAEITGLSKHTILHHVYRKKSFNPRSLRSVIEFINRKGMKDAPSDVQEDDRVEECGSH